MLTIILEFLKAIKSSRGKQTNIAASGAMASLYRASGHEQPGHH